MPYPVGGNILRADLATALEQGLDELKFCIAEKVAPAYDSKSKAGQYLLRTLEQRGSKRLDENRRAPGASYPEVTSSWTSDQYETLDYGYKSKVDDSFKAYADRYLDLESSTARILDAKTMLSYELRVANVLLGQNGSPTAFTVYTAPTAYTAANIATVDFVGDIFNVCETLRGFGTLPNAIVLTYPLWNYVRRAPLFQNYVRGNFPTVLPTVLTPEQGAAVFFEQGVERLIIAGAYQDVGGEGEIFLGSPIWPNAYYFVGKITGGDFLGGGAMRTICWSEDGGFKAVESYRDEDARSDVLRVRQSVSEKTIDARGGVIISTGASNGSKIT
jgi:hypothetical protein